MKCKYCRREIPENSVFCNWCGKKQLKEKDEISVPAPRHLKSSTYFNQVMVKGVRVPVSAETEKDYYAKATMLHNSAETNRKEVPSPAQTAG